MPALTNQARVAQFGHWLRGVVREREAAAHWRDSSWLPSHGSGEWALLVRGKPLTAMSLDEVKSRLHGWSPASTTLVAGPGELRFGSAASQPELARWLRRKYTIGSVLCGCICLALSIIAVLGFLSRPKLPLIGYAITAAILAIVTLLEAHWAATVPQHLADRNLFLHWLAKGPAARQASRFWLGVCALAGLIQLALVQSLGGLEPLVLAYGTYYPAVADHEYWRVLTGPFLHASFAHFLTNSILLVLVGTICAAALGRAAVLVFLIGSVAAASAAAYDGLLAAPGYPFDATSGFSGGIYAVVALLIVAAQFERDLLPTGASLQLLALLAIGMVDSTLIASNVSTAGHVAGMATGAVAGLLVRPRARTALRAELAQRGP